MLMNLKIISKPLSESDRPDKTFPSRHPNRIDPTKLFHAAIRIG